MKEIIKDLFFLEKKIEKKINEMEEMREGFSSDKLERLNRIRDCALILRYLIEGSEI